MYETGRGVERDYAEAAKWYLKAAEQGFAPAQNHLAMMYYSGRGVGQDYREAAGTARPRSRVTSMPRTGSGSCMSAARASRRTTARR